MDSPATLSSQDSLNFTRSQDATVMLDVNQICETPEFRSRGSYLFTFKVKDTGFHHCCDRNVTRYYGLGLRAFAIDFSYLAEPTMYTIFAMANVVPEMSVKC